MPCLWVRPWVRAEASSPSARTPSSVSRALRSSPVRTSDGPSLPFGYILGYFLAVAIAGLAAQRGADRRVLTMAPTALVSLFSVYILGLAWMIPFTHMTFAQGLVKGFVPFIIGDLVKAAVATGAFPMLRSFFR